jgi:hypothetical protein
MPSGETESEKQYNNAMADVHDRMLPLVHNCCDIVGAFN